MRRVITFKQAHRRARKTLQKQQQRFAKDLQALGLSHFGKPQETLWPPCRGHDLILDDEPRSILLAWRQGVKGVLVTNYEPDWTTRIREATLQSPEIEIHTKHTTSEAQTI
ncbi:hypothetical protein [Armatimonas sp.]|uniref:hypothetical protein n=1 Tax=Armatimonas sp. TaxID=1872638 RepID=UPI00286BBDCA|nr:hypothetical protein [Armatimonas sp.]